MTSPRDLSPLLRATGRGDKRAFAALYDATYTEAFTVAIASTGCPDAAADAVRLAYQQVWATASTYRAGWVSAHGWVLSVVHCSARSAAA